MVRLDRMRMRGYRAYYVAQNTPLDGMSSPSPASRSQMRIIGRKHFMDQHPLLILESFHLGTQVQDTVDSRQDTPSYVNSDRYKDENMPWDCCRHCGYEISDILKPVCHRSLRSEP
jgi:hypothetical protein